MYRIQHSGRYPLWLRVSPRALREPLLVRMSSSHPKIWIAHCAQVLAVVVYRFARTQIACARAGARAVPRSLYIPNVQYVYAISMGKSLSDATGFRI